MSSQKTIRSLLCLCFGLLISVSACDSVKTKVEVVSNEKVESPFIHSVYIWFKEGVTQEQKDALAQASIKLTEIKGVLAVYDGIPAATFRATVERSYDYALVIHMKDLATHDAYQTDPIHLDLLKNYSSLWQKVMITDVE